MDPLKNYDHLTLTRGRIFDAIRPLDADACTREFPIGPGTLGRTLTHIMISEWYYVQRMLEREVPPYDEWPIHDEDPPPFDVLEPTWAAQATDTRAAIASITDRDAMIEYRVTNDAGVEQIVTTTAGDLITQLVLHEMHHRAQALNILRHLGVTIDGLDYNAYFARRDA